MLAFKVRPLGLLLFVLALVSVAIGGFVLSRSLSQATVAARGVSLSPDGTAIFSKSARFAHIPATDPSVATALSADDLNGGKSLVGKPTVILGHAVKIFVPEGNQIHLVNFAQKYSSAFSIAIEAKDYGKFPDPKELVGKQVLVLGVPFIYKNQLEIKAESLKQIFIVDGTKKIAPTAR